MRKFQGLASSVAVVGLLAFFGPVQAQDSVGVNAASRCEARRMRPCDRPSSADLFVWATSM